jgi:hypothetical protein
MERRLPRHRCRVATMSAERPATAPLIQRHVAWLRGLYATRPPMRASQRYRSARVGGSPLAPRARFVATVWQMPMVPRSKPSATPAR